MRKAMFLAAAAILAASFTAGHAAGEGTIAQCAGSAGLSGQGVPPSARGVCQITFELAAPTTVAISLEPGVGFVGTLQATVTKSSEGYPVSGLFVNDVAVAGMSNMVVPLDTGTWKLNVTGGAVIACLTPYPPCPPPVGFAFGPFGASITLASS